MYATQITIICNAEMHTLFNLLYRYLSSGGSSSIKVCLLYLCQQSCHDSQTGIFILEISSKIPFHSISNCSIFQKNKHSILCSCQDKPIGIVRRQNYKIPINFLFHKISWKSDTTIQQELSQKLAPVEFSLPHSRTKMTDFSNPSFYVSSDIANVDKRY